MSKYEDEHFANMKISIFLIIGFTHFVFCSQPNTDVSYPVCSLNSFRRKRAVEYTRWRANLDTTQEFIVKILDEELTTPKSRHVAAVNIQPITKGVEKIIIGGAIVSEPTAALSATDILKDYTRFVPPTTIATRVEGDLYLAPAQPQMQLAPAQPDVENAMPILPRVRHPQRDESPPASPQFLPRTPIVASHQYAPITPVGFTRRSTIGPLTPPATDSYNFRKTKLRPFRTKPIEDAVVPTRTKSDLEEFGNFLPFAEDGEKNIARTTFVEQFDPQRTTVEFQYTTTRDINTVPVTTEKNYNDDKKVFDKDSDSGYSMMFYNDDDDESGGKKAGKQSSDIYDDKLKDQEIRPKEKDGLSDSKMNIFNKTVPQLSTEHGYDDIAEELDNLKSMKTTSKTASSSMNIEITTKKTTKAGSRDKRRPICSMIKLRQLNFNSPRTLPEIVAQLKQWAEDSPVAKWVDITDGNYTIMENPIYMMIVDDPSSGQIVSAKQTVMIVAGIQGRDHHAVAAAMYVLYQLIERSVAHADLLTKYRFWIIPVFNPDGYDYSMTFPHRRDWTKNLRQNWDACKGRESCQTCESYGLRCTIQPCYGVNLDRNFEYQWIPADELRAEHPCGTLYAGARQRSEAETRALTKYLHEQRTPLYTFIAFKEGDVLGVMYPYSHTRKKRTFDPVYRQRASRAAAAAYSISGRPYVAGQTSEFLPLYAGGIEDWIDGHLGIDNTYTIMIFRPTDAYNSKMNTERVVHEAYAAMDTLVLQSVEPQGGIQPVTITRVRSSSEILTAQFINILLAIVILQRYFT